MNRFKRELARRGYVSDPDDSQYSVSFCADAETATITRFCNVLDPENARFTRRGNVIWYSFCAAKDSLWRSHDAYYVGSDDYNGLFTAEKVGASWSITMFCDGEEVGELCPAKSLDEIIDRVDKVLSAFKRG